MKDNIIIFNKRRMEMETIKAKYNTQIEALIESGALDTSENWTRDNLGVVFTLDQLIDGIDSALEGFDEIIKNL